MMNLFLASSVNFVAEDIAKRVAEITPNKKLVFIPTAAEVEKGDMTWMNEDQQALIDAGFSLTNFSITDQNEQSIREALKGVGSVCVGGGNNYYLMHQVRKSGFDKVMKDLVPKGLIYIGCSAGSVIAGPTIETSLDDFLPQLKMTDYSGIGLTEATARPHWGSQWFKEKYIAEFSRLYGLKYKIVLLNDNQYLWVKDDWYQICDVN